MIDRDAIEFISQQAVKAAEHQAQPLGTHTPTVVIDGEIKNLEKFGERPVRHRAAFNTRNLAAFIAYSLSAATAQNSQAAVFVNPEEMSASAFYDLGTATEPKFSEDRASLSMKKTAEYQALLKVHEQRLTQKQAADFLIDWAPNIDIIDANGEDLSHAKALAALRSITVQVKAETHNEERDTGRTRSAFEEAEAKSKEVLPAGIIFNCAPYLGLDTRDINVRVTINTEGEKPTITFRIVGLEKLGDELGDELVAKLEDGLKSDAVVTVGTLTSTN